MFEPAKLQMNWARARGTSTLRNAALGFTEETLRPCGTTDHHLLRVKPHPPDQVAWANFTRLG
jgi:hypothetical protein